MANNRNVIRAIRHNNNVISSLLFTCGHDGHLPPDKVQERDISNVHDDCNGQFKKLRDLYTSEITMGVAWQIYLLTGQQPPTVIEKYHRKYMDVNRPNRPINCAYEDEEADPHYYEYHGVISKYLKEMYIRNNDENLMRFLFDFHGYKREDSEKEKDIILGTEDDKTIWKLLENHPNAKKDLITKLEAPGYSIDPENSSLNGGHTINHYSRRSWRYACNAIQFEFADELRTNVDKREKLIVDLANSILQFVTQFFSKNDM
jgi:N-formylglutamate amidohydrolase